jgi:penicillin-binding protein 2
VNLQTDSNKQVIQRRLIFFYVPVIAVTAILAVRLWQLQILSGAEYALQAEKNRIRTIQVVAPRGTITDRNGTPLVENRPSFNILLYRESMTDAGATASFVTTKLGVNPAEFSSLLSRARATPLYQPIVIKEDVGIDDISVVEAHRLEHPELQLFREPRRLYRYGAVGAHVVGYVGEVSGEELEKGVFPGARVGTLVGKFGVERIYNEKLTGDDGSRVVLVDSLGREAGLLEEVDSVIGDDLRLTLDLDLQTTAEELLKEKVGVIVAMDPRNGEILALASSPSFDPNKFSTRISPEAWGQLINDPDRPLQNRAIQNAYPPGSVFKVIMAEAGLDEGLIDDTTRVFCHGSAFFYNRLFHCASKQGHGSVDIENAIARSCNIFFYELGRRLGISRIAERAQALGLGERTGIDLPGERSGLMPSPEWKQRARGAKWYVGETISVSIGQGAVTTTPLQMLRAISCIVTGGHLVTPHVLLRSGGAAEESAPPKERSVAIAPDSMNKIRAGMWQSVNNWGTGHAAAIPGLDICGKTGTVQIIGAERVRELNSNNPALEDHSWFVGFASRDNPEIAVVAFVEHGGKGGIAAAPLAREVFRVYFSRKQSPVLITRVAPPRQGMGRED